MIVRIKYFADIEPMKSIEIGDWIDLRASRDIEIKKDEYAVIPLGVGMILPTGYEAHVVARSSTMKNFGILSANAVGIIDNSYSGDEDEWCFPVVAVRDTVIHKNDRVCQFRLVNNMPQITFETVEHLNEKSRGGLGSTGTK